MRNDNGLCSSGYCLGIESSADDFGVGIATFKGEIIANKSSGYIPNEVEFILEKQQDTMLKLRIKC
jgi:hypothetical protein